MEPCFKLIDFDGSKKLKLTKNSNVTGTFGYQAPEIASGQYSIAVDLWSIGVCCCAFMSQNPKNPTDTWLREKDIGREKLRQVVTLLLNRDPEQRLNAEDLYTLSLVQWRDLEMSNSVNCTLLSELSLEKRNKEKLEIEYYQAVENVEKLEKDILKRRNELYYINPLQKYYLGR